MAILGSPKVSVHSLETSIFTAFQRFVFRDGNLGQLLSKRGGGGSKLAAERQKRKGFRKCHLDVLDNYG